MWKLLADFSPEEIADLVDFRYLSDALTRDEALRILRSARAGRREREQALLEDGFTLIKLKVGGSIDDDVRRMGVARAAVGPDIDIAIDANQRWDVSDAIAWVGKLAEFRSYWIEEPTSPDDVLGHAPVRAGLAPVLVATGEHVQNRVIFKQLLQANAVDVVQIDACRVGGVNENIAILLLAAKFGVRVCPHAGGVGLCEMVRHLSMFNFLAVSGSSDGRTIEYVDHLHEHFLDPAVLRRGRYLAPTMAGFSAQMDPQTLADYSRPESPVWSGSEDPPAR